MTSFETLKLALAILALAGSAGGYLFTYLRTRDAARLAALQELRDRMIAVEGRQADSPTSTAIHEVALSIAQLGGDLKSVVARLDGLGEIVKRLERITERQEDHLRQSGGKGP